MIPRVTEQRPSLWRRMLALLDDGLPMSPDQRAARDHTAYRERRLRLHILEKRGKSGFR